MITQPLSRGRVSLGASATSEFLHKPFQNFANGPQFSLVSGQSVPVEATAAGGLFSPSALPPFFHSDDVAHAAVSVVRSVSHSETDTGEIGNVPKRIWQA